MSPEQTSPQTIVSTTQPEVARYADEWYNPSTNSLYKFLAVNGTSLQWVQISTSLSGTVGTSASALTSVPTLQQVTDAGSTTTNSISIGSTLTSITTSSLIVGALPSFQAYASGNAAKMFVYDNQVGGIVNAVGDGVAAAFRAYRFTNDASGAINGLIKFRGTYASPLAVVAGDQIGGLNLQAFAGSSTYPVAQIYSYIDTYTANDNLSGYITFNTRPIGLSATPTERVRIDSVGNLLVGTTSSGVATGGNIYSGGRVGFVGTQSTSVVYQYYNTLTNSLDFVFG